MLAILLITMGLLFRLIPHAPNFSPVAAIALFGACTISNKKIALLAPLSIIMMSDFLLGLHSVVFFTWGSFLIISAIGVTLRTRKKPEIVLIGSFVSALLFFVITNFGVWLTGWYPPTAAGLMNCFIAALPFFRNTLVSTLCYSTIFFAAYELGARTVRRTKLAKVLLTI